MKVVYQTEPKRFRIEERFMAPTYAVASEWEHVDGANDYEGAELTVRRLEGLYPTAIYRIVDTAPGD